MQRLRDRLLSAEVELDAREVEAARGDVNNFVELVGRYQWSRHPDGRPVESYERLVQSSLHEEMQSHMERSAWYMHKGFPGSGKTTQVALRQVWKLGQDTNRRMLICSLHVKRADPAPKLSRIMREYVKSREVQQVFPDLRTRRSGTDWTWSVHRRSPDDDPTCRTMHYGGSPTGGRPNVIVFDDLYDDSVVRSEADARNVVRWVQKNVFSRFGVNPDTEVVWLTNHWHDRGPPVLLREEMEDLLESDLKSPWLIVERPLVDKDGRSIYPDIVSDERLPILRSRVGEQFAPLYELRPLREEDRGFKIEVLERVFREDVEVIDELELDDEQSERFLVLAGLDPAGGKTRRGKGDRTAIPVVMYDKVSRLYRTLWVESGRWPVEEVALRVLELQLAFNPSEFVCEDNGVQNWMRRIVDLEYANRAMNCELMGIECSYVRPNLSFFTTGSNKHDPDVGVRSLITEFRDGRHLAPSTRIAGECQSALIRMRDGFYGFSEKSHTADECMAYWFVVSRIRTIVRGLDLIREGNDRPRSRALSIPRTERSRERSRARSVMFDSLPSVGSWSDTEPYGALR